MKRQSEIWKFLNLIDHFQKKPLSIGNSLQQNKLIRHEEGTAMRESCRNISLPVSGGFYRKSPIPNFNCSSSSQPKVINQQEENNRTNLYQIYCSQLSKKHHEHRYSFSTDPQPNKNLKLLYLEKTLYHNSHQHILKMKKNGMSPQLKKKGEEKERKLKKLFFKNKLQPFELSIEQIQSKKDQPCHDSEKEYLKINVNGREQRKRKKSTHSIFNHLIKKPKTKFNDKLEGWERQEDDHQLPYFP